jgi:hypothetical protein
MTMARVSFLLQRTLFEPSDNGASTGFLDVITPCYGEVVVTWNVPSLTEINESTVVPWTGSTSAPVTPTEVIVVYSNAGIPQTVLSGDVLFRGPEVGTLTQNLMPTGRWAYYSLFLRYTDLSTGGSYYERVASTGVIPTVDYGSTQQLWKRVPLHYRVLDERLATPLPPGTICGYAGQLVGPLYKFLSVIGFEMDRIRTLTDAFVVAKDPFIGSPRSLDLTARNLGIPIQSADLGDQRLRRLLSSIGFLRRSKGTLEALRLYLTSFVGTNLSIFSNGELRVHSQRVNYAPNPKVLGASSSFQWRPAFVTEIKDTRSFNFFQIDQYKNEYVYSDGAWRFVDGHEDLTDDLTLVNSLLGVVSEEVVTTQEFDPLLSDDFVSYENGLGSGASVTTNASLLADFVNDRSFLVGQLWRFDLQIPVRNGDRVVFSTRGEGSDSILWGRLVNSVDGTIMGEGRSANLRDDDNVQLLTDLDEDLFDFVPDPVSPLGVSNLNNYIEMPVFVDEERTSNINGWITVNVEILVDLRQNGFAGDLMLAERNYFGPYFDGDTVFGGWFNGDPSVSDFRWEGTPNDSRSLYTEDYERTRQFIELVYRDLIPISVLPSYSLTQFDYVAGTEQILEEIRF